MWHSINLVGFSLGYRQMESCLRLELVIFISPNIDDLGDHACQRMTACRQNVAIAEAMRETIGP